ncbi:hypothetical protein RCL1_005570 [Eukaryota sp. TZLM3-RCL]
MWVQKVSRSTGRPFYFNTQTQESTWDCPPDFQAPVQYRASHLLVKHKNSRRPSSWREPVITRTEDEALSILNGYREQIVSGHSSFEGLASKYSDCGSAQNGGDLGNFGPGQMQKAFEDAVKSLAVGEISGPVWTDSGVHIIKRFA